MRLSSGLVRISLRKVTGPFLGQFENSLEIQSLNGKKVFPVSVIRKLKTGLGWDFCVLVGYLCVSGVYKPGSRRLFKNRHV